MAGCDPKKGKRPSRGGAAAEGPRCRETDEAAGHGQSILHITEEQLGSTFRTNIYGYFYMVQAALPHLKRGAAIINTGSVTALRGNAGLLDYSATKGAIHVFTRSLAQSGEILSPTGSETTR